jgi:hypothetical protein
LSESKNLAADEPVKVKQLHARLIAWRKEVNAILPTANKDSSALSIEPSKEKTQRN